MSLQHHPSIHAAYNPNHPAIINATTGVKISYGEMNTASIRLANRLHSTGLRAGDNIAVMVKNHEGFFIAMWAGLRSGLIVTPISTQLKPREAMYIIEDCHAKSLLIDISINEIYPEITNECSNRIPSILINNHPQNNTDTEYPEYPEEEGNLMLYSSGTTGHPKGIVTPWQRTALGDAMTISLMLESMFGFNKNSRFYTGAPLYHAAPLHWSLGTHRLGGTVIISERFDAESCLKAIQEHYITHSLWVPTMFVRLLNLPDSIRQKYDLSSLQFAAHLAAPCAIAIKEKMINWWGPIIHELYSGSEGNGQCHISPEDWLDHKGSVGKPMYGSVFICDDDGNILPPGKVGLVGFSNGLTFSYHKDAQKTRDSILSSGITTLGDMGYLDDDGFLYLTGRKGQTIISGGVNIYPKEVENLLMQHEAIEDCFVFPIPDEEYGEIVAAGILLKPHAHPFITEKEIIGWCKIHGASVKAPKKVFFCTEIPRMATGKLAKADQEQLVQQFLAKNDH